MLFPIHRRTRFTSLSLDTGSAGEQCAYLGSRVRASERVLTHSSVSSGSFTICLSRCDLVKAGIPVYTDVWISKQHIPFGPWIEQWALKCPPPRPPRHTLPLKYVPGSQQDRAWQRARFAEIRLWCSQCSDGFNICSLDRNPIRATVQKGESSSLLAPKKPFSFVWGWQGVCPGRLAAPRVRDVIRGFSEASHGAPRSCRSQRSYQAGLCFEIN